MSWLANLAETYEHALQLDITDGEKPVPVFHTIQNAHINIVIDGTGNFLSAKVLEKPQVVLPATEASAGRTSGVAPHPLADNIQYIARGYAAYVCESYLDQLSKRKKQQLLNRIKRKNESYLDQLSKWCNSEHSHSSAKAVLNYVSKQNVIQYLVTHQILHVDENNELFQKWTNEEHEPPAIFKVLTKVEGVLDQGSALVCWSVESPGRPETDTWKDASLQKSWTDYASSQSGLKQRCYVTGKSQAIALSHPAKLRHSGDKAKLISANDMSGFTFRGRFTDTKESSEKYGLQSAVIGDISSQKAHNALRWLISKQKNRNGDQAFVAWATSGEEVANPLEIDLTDLNYDEIEEPAEDTPVESKVDQSANLGQAYAEQLKLLMKGYQSRISHDATISVMMIGSATPTHGRMGIAYYRESLPETYYKQLLRWHTEFAWFQPCKKDIPQSKGKPKSLVQWLPGSPSPYSMMNAVYGDILKGKGKGNDTLKKNFMERLIPSIIEGVQIPIDFVNCAFERARNPAGKEKWEWEWEKCLGVACALYRGSQIRNPDTSKRKEFKMALETDNTSRDYLYGRLLAIAERIEDTALRVSGINRPTAASRLMQRFSDRPYSTWLSIYKQLDPYMRQLKNSRGGFLTNMEKELDQVMNLFESETFKRDDKLTPEFLLGFHSERLHLHTKSKSSEPGETNTTEE